ncbi:MAG: peptidylprolyl isomerase [Candidatus Krumholzibacteria bacterium]|nr:peptidylprolyl isomerase [Candidatus Krumholzibacteria bacterium]
MATSNGRTGRAALAGALLLCVLAQSVPAACAAARAFPAPVQDEAVDAGVVPGEARNPRLVLDLETEKTVVIELFADEAPITVERIMELADEGFYDGSEFHRVESWLVQAGKDHFDEHAPIEGEMFSQDFKHERGMVGMARLVDDYDSGATQFYIMKEHKAVLNGEYTIFGCVVEGMDCVMGIEKGCKIVSARIER